MTWNFQNLEHYRRIKDTAKTKIPRKCSQPNIDQIKNDKSPWKVTSIAIY
jgi:hypothetical protein